MTSPRDRFLTVYGRRPVLEALADERMQVDKVLVADSARGPEIDGIVRAAKARAVELRRVPQHDVTRLSRNGRQDQGVAADVVAPAMRSLDEWTPPSRDGVDGDGAVVVVVLDGITNPQNVGMILRTATAAGVDGIVVPTAGVADLGPLVVKASAGVAFQAPILRSRHASDAVAVLRSLGFRIYGLAADGDRTLFDPAGFASHSALVLGGEHAGLTVEVDEHVSIPMAGDVESLNVAVAAGVVCFELLRRRVS
ncbi:MAG TPA: RNA methyltransferase [Acidimicrobiales bacterium]